MSELLIEYMNRPKLVSVYRHVGAYREIESAAGVRQFHVLFSRGGAKFSEVVLSEDEIASFVDVDRSEIEQLMAQRYGHYRISTFHYPISIRAIDSQLQSLGEGYNYNWESVERDGNHVGWVNHSLQIVALLGDEDMALRRLPMVEVEYGGCTYEGMLEDHVFTRVGQVWLGAGNSSITTVEAAKDLSQRVLKYFSESSGRYRREVPVECLSKLTLLGVSDSL